MATEMDHEAESRVFAAATDVETLNEFKQLELQILEDGNIGGLNGILLGVAAESGLRGGCLLGEMPHIFAQLPVPESVAGGSEGVQHDCEDRDRLRRAFRASERDGPEAR